MRLFPKQGCVQKLVIFQPSLFCRTLLASASACPKETGGLSWVTPIAIGGYLE